MPSTSSEQIGTLHPLHVLPVQMKWKVSHSPVANTQATATRAAAGAGLMNVCTGLTITFCAGAVAPTAVLISVAVIDGASGGTTYLWGPFPFSLPAVAGAMNGLVEASLYIPGSANTPMTVEFSATGGANTIQAVMMRGTTLQVYP
jgi:hypothetical protein